MRTHGNSLEQDLPARLNVTSIQLRTFLALVCDGSVTRVSQRFGFSRSTVSAHAKAVGEEFGARLFKRKHAGIVVTREGLRVHALLRPLMDRLDHALADNLAPGQGGPLVRVAVNADVPGTPLDALFEPQSGPAMVPVYDMMDENAPLRAGFFPPRDDGGLRQIRDRWALIRLGPDQGFREDEADPAELAGRRVLIPGLPEVLQSSVQGLAEQARFQVEWTGQSLAELLSRVGQGRNLSVLVPSSLLQTALIQPFDCRWLPETRFDPVLSVWHRPGHEDLAGAIHDALARSLTRPALTRAINEEPDERQMTEILSLKHCRSFMALYEEGNVRKAAERMFIVQPAMSLRLRSIEEAMGGALFDRVRYGLDTTPRADALYKALRPILGDLDRAIHALRNPGQVEAARLRVGLVPALDEKSAMAVCFAAGLESWSGVHAGSDIQVVEGYSPTLIHWLHARKIDYALVDRITPDDALDYHCLSQDSMAVVTARGSDLLPEGPVRLRDIVRLPLVLPSSRHGLRALLYDHLRELDLTLEPRMEIDSMAAALSLVKIGSYATILPSNALKTSSDRSQLSIHEIRDPTILRTICVAQRREDGAARGPAFTEDLRRAFSANDAALVNAARA